MIGDVFTKNFLVPFVSSMKFRSVEIKPRNFRLTKCRWIVINRRTSQKVETFPFRMCLLTVHIYQKSSRFRIDNFSIGIWSTIWKADHKSKTTFQHSMWCPISMSWWMPKIYSIRSMLLSQTKQSRSIAFLKTKFARRTHYIACWTHSRTAISVPEYLCKCRV